MVTKCPTLANIRYGHFGKDIYFPTACFNTFQRSSPLGLCFQLLKHSQQAVSQLFYMNYSNFHPLSCICPRVLPAVFAQAALRSGRCGLLRPACCAEVSAQLFRIRNSGWKGRLQASASGPLWATDTTLSTKDTKKPPACTAGPWGPSPHSIRRQWQFCLEQRNLKRLANIAS